MDTVASTLVSNNGAIMLQRPRIQTSSGVPVQIFVGSVWPTAGISSWNGPSPKQIPPKGLVAGVLLELTCSVRADGFVLRDIRQEVEITAGRVTIDGVGRVPITVNRTLSARVPSRKRQTVLLGGFIQKSKAPLFSELNQLKRFPKLGDLVNRLITYPKHTTYAEIVVLVRVTLLPAPEISSWRKTTIPGIRPVEEAIKEEELKRLRAAEDKRPPCRGPCP